MDDTRCRACGLPIVGYRMLTGGPMHPRAGDCIEALRRRMEELEKMIDDWNDDFDAATLKR